MGNREHRKVQLRKDQAARIIRHHVKTQLLVEPQDRALPLELRDEQTDARLPLRAHLGGAGLEYRVGQVEPDHALDRRAEVEDQRLAADEAASPGGGEAILSADQAREIERFQEDKVRIRKELRAVKAGLETDIKALGMKMKLINILVMPVVFTSTLVHATEGQEYFPTAWLGDMKHAISQTPQVWLDHSVFEDERGLMLNWHAAADLFPPGAIEEMFGAYVGLLERLVGED